MDEGRVFPVRSSETGSEDEHDGEEDNGGSGPTEGRNGNQSGSMGRRGEDGTLHTVTEQLELHLALISARAHVPMQLKVPSVMTY